MPPRFLCAATCFLLTLGACDGDAKTPNTATEQSPAQGEKKKQAKTPALEAKAGDGSKKIVATLGHPNRELGGTEGEACFGYDDQPDKSYCFTLETKKASWAEVFGENYPLREIRARSEAENKAAKVIKKPVLEQQDAPE